MALDAKICDLHEVGALSVSGLLREDRWYWLLTFRRRLKRFGKLGGVSIQVANV